MYRTPHHGWHSRRSLGIGALALAVCSALLLRAPGSARASSAAWNLAYPETMSYRVLSTDRNVKCSQSDSVFNQELAAEHLDKYEIYVVVGHTGDCGRLKAEQLKRLYPQKMVLVYESPAADDPRTWPGGTWAGYYLMMNRTTAMSAVSSTQTTINVGNGAFFSVGDTAVMWSPNAQDPYANSEWVSVTAINGNTLTVKRNYFGTGARTYATAPLIAAAATGPGYPLPDFNLSDMAPVNPANGKRAWQWLAANMGNDFAASSASAPTMDGMELDAVGSTPWPVVKNVKGATKNVDCNGDGIIDYCQRNVGTAQQVDSYGVGYDDFIQSLKADLATYDTDATRPPKMLLADGSTGLRSVADLNGAEFESYPTWDNYSFSSFALGTLDTWQSDAGATGTHMSYAFTKDATPLYPQAGCKTPAQGGTCRNGEFRYGMASALISGGASTYNNETTFNYEQPWDEEATIDNATSGLAAGYLGRPLGAAVRTTRYTSGELDGNGDFTQSLTGLTPKLVSGANLSMVRDTTTAAPGGGTASLRVDVTRLTAVPNLSDARVFNAITGSVSPGEYTVDFWAKSQNTLAGPAALNIGVSMANVTDSSLLTTNTWTHYTLQFSVPTSTSKAEVRFLFGGAIGHYWIDRVSVHKGTAGIITRQFTNGIVVLNDSFTTQTNVALPGGPYHHINGVQDRTVNNGASVGSLLPSIAAKDGMVLLRG